MDLLIRTLVSESAVDLYIAAPQSSSTETNAMSFLFTIPLCVFPPYSAVIYER